jgi:hypothetical protein
MHATLGYCEFMTRVALQRLYQASVPSERQPKPRPYPEGPYLKFSEERTA